MTPPFVPVATRSIGEPWAKLPGAAYEPEIVATLEAGGYVRSRVRTQGQREVLEVREV